LMSNQLILVLLEGTDNILEGDAATRSSKWNGTGGGTY
jgi:hypothetical protein